MTPEARDLLRAVIGDPVKVADVPPAVVPAALGALAELQAILLARLVSGGNGAHPAPQPDGPEQLITADEAAARFNVTRRWLYRHGAQMGARRLSRKVMRFTESGIRRYLARLPR